MLYTFRLSKFKKAYVYTWDGVVTETTPSMKWAIDKPIETVVSWAESKYIGWTVEDSPPTTGTKPLPSDSEIASTVAP